MIKKTTSVLSVILMLTFLTPCLSLSFETSAKSNNDFEYEVYYNEWVMITKYNGTENVVSVPDTLDFKPVMSIGEGAFEGCGITEVTIPSSVKCIYDNAFDSCRSLEKVNLTEGLKTIYSCFQNTSFSEITIPKSVSYISGSAFKGNDSIKKIHFLADYYKDLEISEITYGGFGLNCDVIFDAMPSAQADLGLRSAAFTETEAEGKYIYTFSPGYQTGDMLYTSGEYNYTIKDGKACIRRYLNDKALNVEIPSKLNGLQVTEIEDYAFSTFVNDEQHLNGEDFYSYSFESVTIPDSITKIGRYAFAGNQNLKTVKLPANLKTIQYGTFKDCTALNEIVFPKRAEIIADHSFENCNITNLNLPDGLKRIYKCALDIDETSSFALPDSIEYIGINAFCGYPFTDIALPDNLKYMDMAFENCETLSSVTFNNSLEGMNGTFIGCENIKTIEIPESLTTIGCSTFEQCYSLESVKMSSNVNCIEACAFANCTSLEDFEWNAKTKEIKEDAFKNCPLKSFDFSNSEGIKPGAFAGTNIQKVKIGETDTPVAEPQSVGAFSFMNCPELETAAIGGNINEINTKAFAGCENLKTVIIADSVTKIADDAFEGSDNLTIFCTENSYAESFAVNQSIEVTTLVIAAIPNQTYTSQKIEPALSVSMSGEKLTSGKNYTVSYYNNINVGTASAVVTGTGDYSLLISKAQFAIIARDINDAQISGVTDMEYNGTPCTPEVTVKYNRKTLQAGTDYTVTYENNTSVGTGTVRVKGIGNFKGTATVTFEIKEVKSQNGIVKVFNAILNFFVKIIHVIQSAFK